MIGALPILTLLPLALLKMPESVPWLVARGQLDKARAISETTGVPMPDSVPEAEKAERVGFAGLFSRRFWFATVVVGIDGRPRPVPQLLPQHVVAGVDGTGRIQYQGLARLPPRSERRRNRRCAGRLPLRRSVRAQTGCRCVLPDRCDVHRIADIRPAATGSPTVCRHCRLRHHRTSILIYGLVANHFPTKMRGAAVAWAAGFGRLGGVSGPLLGGLFLAAGLGVNSVFYVLAGLALVGVFLTLLVPKGHRAIDIHSTPVEPTVPLGTGDTRSVSRADNVAVASVLPRQHSRRRSLKREMTMYDRILVAIDAAPDAPDDALRRTAQFAKMTGGTVHLVALCARLCGRLGHHRRVRARRPRRRGRRARW